MKPLGKPIKWDSLTAYAVGLITTDGNLSADKCHMDFTSKDKGLVQIFKKCLNLKNKIGRKTRCKEKIKKYFRIQFGNVILYKWLVNVGLMPNKSRRIGPLKIPKRYFFNFLRGHLDGDGCIRKFQDPVYPNSQRLYTIFHSASLAHLKWLQQRINFRLNIHGFVELSSREYRLTFAKKESLILLPKIYFDKKVPCLKRKYDIAKSVLNFN